MLSIADLPTKVDENSGLMLEEFDCDFDFLDLHGSEHHTRQSGNHLDNGYQDLLSKLT